MDTSKTRVKLNYFQNEFSSAFKNNIIEMANNEPLIVENLPSGIQRRFNDENNQLFRINIYSDKDIFNHISLSDEISSNNIKHFKI